jgi:hypothetical protein
MFGGDGSLAFCIKRFYPWFAQWDGFHQGDKAERPFESLLKGSQRYLPMTMLTGHHFAKEDHALPGVSVPNAIYSRSKELRIPYKWYAAYAAHSSGIFARRARFRLEAADIQLLFGFRFKVQGQCSYDYKQSISARDHIYILRGVNGTAQSGVLCGQGHLLVHVQSSDDAGAFVRSHGDLNVWKPRFHSGVAEAHVELTVHPPVRRANYTWRHIAVH